MSGNLFDFPYQQTQLHRELLNVMALSPFDGTVSASRKQMFSSHIGQTLVISGGTPRRTFTGMERKYAKTTFSIRMPVDAMIIKIVERYPQTVGYGSIKENPETLLIYENHHTKEIGCISLPKYCSNHPYFGFEYKPTKELKNLKKGSLVKEGTVLLDSPTVSEDGDYCYGVDLNVAYMSHPAVSEDGILISRSALEKIKFKIYETRTVEFGSKYFPLNTYGDKSNYKPHPDIGDPVRPDGILMALRSYDNSFSPCEMGIASTMRVDDIFDKMVCAPPGGKIIDIKILHDEESTVPLTPIGMEKQPTNYDCARIKFYQSIYDEYKRLMKDSRGQLSTSLEFRSLVVSAMAALNIKNSINKNNNERVSKQYKNVPLDDWRLEFVIEYEITPNIGYKLTDLVGGKGVIVAIAEDDEMPVDSEGNRADVVMDQGATVSRMNIGRLYEQYFNCSARDLLKEIQRTLNFEERENVLQKMDTDNDPTFNQVWTRLIEFYKIVSPKYYEWFTTGVYKQTRANHIHTLLKENVIRIYHPPETDHELVDCVRQLKKYYPSTYGPVSYVGYSGQRCVTKRPIRIGPVYMILLEKTGDDWAAVASGRLQNHGVLAQITNADKHSQPTRGQAVRAFGETEVRIVSSYIGPDIAAEILDRNNSIATHRQVSRSILTAVVPSTITDVVDRTEFSLGNARPLQQVKHLAMCSGWTFEYEPYTPPTVPTPILNSFKAKWNGTAFKPRKPTL